MSASPMRPEITRLAALLLAATLAAAAAAQQSGEPLELEADSVVYNEETGISVYRGNVKIVQGEITLKGDTVEVFTKDGAISKLVATAGPSRLVRRRDGQTLRAEALRIEYRADEGIMDLRGKARIADGWKALSGDHIVYDARKKIVKATKDKNRVRLTLRPDKKEPR
ncbi:MAG: lipopolysaccharide transport periplasmic protein LptA [Gammaproteobacteria bacterium]|nr:lipopolysaccharide transport periplasmic protein LptA [Gammaproteobacteria bacterium]MDD9868925.1 lipopolysaccharide transport periplasmic protein LptA [Gammaproteobacteria bacterium]